MNAQQRKTAVLVVRFGPTLLLGLLMAGLATAQILTGMIEGTVTDTTGAVVAGATVTAVDTATSHAYKATTGSGGDYRIGNLPNGQYNVTIEAKGFKREVVSNVQVNVSQAANVSAKLQ